MSRLGSLDFLNQSSEFSQISRDADEMKKLSNRDYNNREDALEASRGFEAILVKSMLNSMTSSLENSSFFGDLPGADYYQDVFINAIAEKISSKGEMGISELIMKQLFPEETNINAIREINNSDYSSLNRISAYRVKDLEQNTSIPNILKERLARYDRFITQAANKYGIDKNLIRAVISQESYGNYRAVSSAGAKGLMQLMDGTAAGLGVTDSFDPRQNILAGTRYLRMMLDRYDNDLELALAAYNAGPGNVEKYNGVPPFRETQNYIKKVNDYYNRFQ